MAKTPARPPARAANPAEAAVVAIVGNEPYLQRTALEQLLAAAPADVQRLDAEGATADAGDVFDEVRSVAMFGGARLVVVRDADEFITKHRASVETFLEDLESGSLGGNRLVFRCNTLAKNTRVYKLIDKIGRVVVCEPPKDRELPAWIAERGKLAYGVAVSRDAAALLADLIGGDLGTLDNELAKLSLQVGDGGKVTPDLISGGVAFRREQEMWRLTDALTAGEPGRALEVWRQLLATDDSAQFRAVTWLGLWLEKAAGALRLKRRGEKSFAIAKQLRVWPAQNVEPLLKTADALGEVGLAAAVDRLAELDYRIKTGLGAGERAVEGFIVSTAGVPREGAKVG